jgi:hypothetical protein
VRKIPDAFGSQIGNGQLAPARELRDRLGDGIVEASVEGAKR